MNVHFAATMLDPLGPDGAGLDWRLDSMDPTMHLMARSVQRAVMTAPTVSVLDAAAKARRRPGLLDKAAAWANEAAIAVREPGGPIAVSASR